jgi:hypothetical protein
VVSEAGSAIVHNTGQEVPMRHNVLAGNDVIATFLTVSLLPAFAAGDQAAESVFLKGSEIYATKPGTTEARQLTADGLQKGSLVTSKDGRRFAFVRDSQGRALGDIVVMQPDGTTLREIRFRPPEAHVIGMRFIEGLEWISDQRLVVSGSVNPSTGEYAVVDIGTGKEVDGCLTEGSAWAASPDGSHMAYVGYVPHFTPEDSRRPQFCLDSECGIDKPFGGYPDPTRHLEFEGSPVWAPDGRAAAIAAENYETHAESVIVRPVGGKPLEIVVPPGAGGSFGFSSEGKNLVIRVGNGAWRLESGATEFTPIR